MLGSVQQNNTVENLVFGPLIQSADHVTAATGKSPIVTISKNGAAFATPAGAVTEIGNGLYMIAANAIDANTAGLLAIHAVAVNCDPYDDWYDVQSGTTQSTATAAPASTISTVNVTGRSVINMALKLLGVLSPGESADSGDEADAFTLLNGMLDGWGAQRLTMYAIGRATYSWPASASSKTLGASGADFTGQAPTEITRAGYIPTGLTQEFSIPVGDEVAYAAVPDKTLTSALPASLYVESTWPSVVLRLFPIPTGAVTLCLYTPTALTQFADLTTIYTLPHGYGRALTYALAREIASLFKATALSTFGLIVEIADSAIADLKRQNLVVPTLRLDPLLTGRPAGIYNINTDGR